MKDIRQEVFNHFDKEHGLILLETELDYIIELCSENCRCQIERMKTAQARTSAKLDYYSAQLYKLRSMNNINTQGKILENVLNNLLTKFDSEEDKQDFILDIINEYKKEMI